MNKAAVTGANGFVGRAAVDRLLSLGFDVRRIVRRLSDGSDIADTVAVGDVDGSTDWSKALAGVDVVIHLVGRTHVIQARENDPLPFFRKVNVEGTRRLAEQAAAARVRRLVFVSSIKVNGERTLGRPFRAKDKPAPEDAYGLSKREAEEALLDVAMSSGMETVIIRPPLIYGPGVKGNFARLMSLIAKGMPLPLGSVKNRRSIVALPNLVDLLLRCMDSPKAANCTFLVKDDECLSTPQLISSIATAMGRRAWLLPGPVGTLQFLARLAGRQAEIDRLCGSLEVDDSYTRDSLDWRPPTSLQEALRATVQQFMTTYQGTK